MAEDKASPIENMSRMMGAGFNKKRKDELYFGKPPKDAYMGMNKGRDLEHIHDLQLSPERKEQLYGIKGSNVKDAGDLAEFRLSTDSKSDLIRELADNTTMTRREAEAMVDTWMAHNDLVEVNDPDLGKIIVPRGSR